MERPTAPSRLWAQPEPGANDILFAISNKKGGYPADSVFALSSEFKTRDALDRICLDQPDFDVSTQ
ncbi:hypothetical protein HDE77_000718 [Rhodanobacter sp. MP7CTX1]|jgi:hypothetical protein|nr:hypothetical protein [Rhodanobacter sp. MP7CTX1]